jgi:beta propeller repeat protein
MDAKKVFCVILLISAFIPQSEGIKTYTSCNQYIKISPDNEIQNEEPAIFENRVVWTTNDNIFLHEITKNTTKKITNTLADKNDAAIFQDRILWVEFAEDAQIYSCELSKNGNNGGCEQNDTKIKITNELGLKQEPSLFLNRTVWEQFDGSDFEIVMCDFSLNNATGSCQESDQKIKITNNSIDDRNAVIFGNYIVWESGRSPDRNIEYYDLAANRSSTLTANQGKQQKPQIFYENGVYAVVYGSNEFNNDDILYKKIGDNATQQLTNGKFDEWDPVINNFGEKSIFWLSSKFGYAHAEGLSQEGIIDASLRQTFKQDHLAVFNKTMVFESWNQSRSEIWMAEC